MADSDLAELRKQCIESLYLCTDNVSKYVDSEKNAEFARLRTCVKEYCLLEAQQDLEMQALVMAKRETDSSNLNTLDDRFKEQLNRLVAQRRLNLDGHPFMMQFERKVQSKARHTPAPNLDESDIVMTASHDTYLDPITKRPIEVPVRNTMCGHVYERDAILNHMKRNRARCPAMGCGNPHSMLPEHLVEDDALRLRISHQHNGLDSQ